MGLGELSGEKYTGQQTRDQNTRPWHAIYNSLEEHQEDIEGLHTGRASSLLGWLCMQVENGWGRDKGWRFRDELGLLRSSKQEADGGWERDWQMGWGETKVGGSRQHGLVLSGPCSEPEPG